MRYYKLIENGYITAIGTGGGGTEITEQEHAEIMSVIQNKPPRTATTDYRLKPDLTWEEYERIEPEPEPEVPDNFEDAAQFIVENGLMQFPPQDEPDYFNENEQEPDYFNEGA